MRSALLLLVVVSLLATALPASSSTTTSNAAVTDQAYTRHDGGTDVTIAACSTNNRQQNEPTVAVDPRNASIVTAGSNDYCSTPTAGDAWRGYYLSTDGGATWNDSLVPGYWTDTSAAGMASPLYHVDNAAGDPVQAWDAHGRVFVGGNAFNRALPQNGNVWVATYDNPQGPGGDTGLDGSRYVRTVIVGKGTPGYGAFNDKTAIEVDRTGGACDGFVYFSWSLFFGNMGSNQIAFSRSTDHGASFSQPVKISDGVRDNQFADIAVGPDGAVYVAWRMFDDRGGSNQVMLAKSTDCGKTFSRPAPVAAFDAFDSYDFSMAAKEGPEGLPPTTDGEPAKGSTGSRDCGDPPYDCASGYTYFRFDSQPAIAADGTGVYVAWNARGPDGNGQVFLSRSTDGGLSWSAGALVDPVAGHQLFPDVAAEGGRIVVVYYDSRNDPCYSPDRPMGNDANGDSCGPSLDAYASTSTDGGASWSHTRLSTASHNPNYEMFGNRRVPFHGDYVYVSSVGGRAAVVWTDNRDVVPGTDPRFPTDTDGDDVLQCRTQNADGSWSADTCPDAGGLDQNIYVAWT